MEAEAGSGIKGQLEARECQGNQNLRHLRVRGQAVKIKQRGVVRPPEASLRGAEQKLRPIVPRADQVPDLRPQRSEKRMTASIHVARLRA